MALALHTILVPPMFGLFHCNVFILNRFLSISPIIVWSAEPGGWKVRRHTKSFCCRLFCLFASAGLRSDERQPDFNTHATQSIAVATPYVLHTWWTMPLDVVIAIGHHTQTDGRTDGWMDGLGGRWSGVCVCVRACVGHSLLQIVRVLSCLSFAYAELCLEGAGAGDDGLHRHQLTDDFLSAGESREEGTRWSR